MKTLFNLFRTAERVVSADDKFNSASALSTYALSTFDRIVEDLQAANVDLDDVAQATGSEIEDVRASAERQIAELHAKAAAEVDRLRQLRDAAMSQAIQNSTVIGNVRRLVATPGE